MTVCFTTDESPTTKASGEKTAAPGREDISSIATGSQDMATGEDAQAAAISPDGTEAITQDESTENGEPMSRPATDSGPEERRTPLARAVEMANLDIVRLLLDRDADMMLRTSLSRQTALHIAVDLELLDIVGVRECVTFWCCIISLELPAADHIVSLPRCPASSR